MSSLPRVLIIGSTGVFGQRLARHLASFPGIELIVTSRSQSKAEALANELQGQHTDSLISGLALDHQKNLSAVLEQTKPTIVVDCSGPFQTASYATARAVLQAGAHLIDLADARDYLKGFTTELDTIAQRHKVVGLTGASSTPALSSCVVEQMTQGWQQVDSIDICITPGGKSEVGRSVIEAIMSYAGRDIPVWQGGRLGTTTGWASSRIVDMPGLGWRRVAPVETLDAELLGELYRVRSHVSFAAGLESGLEQWGMLGIAKLRRLGLFPHPKHIIPLLLAARKLTRLTTSDQGGMLVDMCGVDAAGKSIRVRWSLLAKQDNGPNVPILAAAAAVKKLLDGGIQSGAYLAHQQLGVNEILSEAAGYEISSTHTQHN